MGETVCQKFQSTRIYSQIPANICDQTILQSQRDLQVEADEAHILTLELLLENGIELRKQTEFHFQFGLNIEHNEIWQRERIFGS